MPPGPGCPGKVSWGEGGGKRCPSAASPNPAAACGLWNGKMPVAKISIPFGKAQLRVNRLCETRLHLPASFPSFIQRRIPGPRALWGLRPGQREGGQSPGQTSACWSRGSAAAAPPLPEGGRGEHEPARLEGPRDTNDVPALPLPCGCPGCGCFYISGLGGRWVCAFRPYLCRVCWGGCRPALLVPPAPREAVAAPGTAEAVGRACAHISATPRLLVLGPGHQRLVERGLIFLLHDSFTLRWSLLRHREAALLQAANPSSRLNLFSSSLPLQSPSQAGHRLIFLLQRSSR